ncbi:ornithine decarboxylase [Goodfellowiella coeruleoviolacea]|uniref:ornithine decarboxylase n=2 Tax=Goodfellowiella coeruleoviolacea TaxID=334858 RepID=A0AAE3KJV2_9PSEU|nr:ornithine decarboxylase [Goodfellowiella coeruleoviolacea]
MRAVDCSPLDERVDQDHSEEYRRIREFIAESSAETPYLVFDTGMAANRYRRLAAAFPDTQVFYAVKANPQPALLRTLVNLGSSFDVASRGEIEECLAQGAAPESLSYGNPIKKVGDIRYAHQRGVRLFVFDSEAELRKLAEHAPGASVFCRILASSAGAQWPLSGKFGCSPAMAAQLLVRARDWGLNPIGLSFHVGSQQLDPWRWEPSVAQAASVFAEVERHGIRLTMLNVGGGFPARYTQEVPDIGTYATAIREAVRRHFGASAPAVAVEPGRYIAAEAGVLRAEVVLVSRKAHDDETRWVYLDVGRFGGLAETEGEAIQYRLASGHGAGPDGPVVLAGPTCDSVDILYQRAGYRLPLALTSGDQVDILAAGAYTATYSSVGFNGFGPLPTFCIGDDNE